MGQPEPNGTFRVVSGRLFLVNENHRQCGSDEWRAVVRNAILPWALGDVDLGDDVLEVGPGYGATTDVLGERLPRLTAVEIDENLAVMLEERFAGNAAVTIVGGDATALDFPDNRFSGAASFTMLHHVQTEQLQDRLFSEVLRVLRAGGCLVAGDSLHSPQLASRHDGDTYNPIDPARLPDRLISAGFLDVEVKTNEFGWAAMARKP
jgi:SAM-dependent methyltransferase